MKYRLEIEFFSSVLVGSGEGFGTFIDTDVVFDDFGIPYVPAKRIKGCLRDSAIEVCEMLKTGGLDYIPLVEEDSENRFGIISQLFGFPGGDEPAPLYISNLTIKGYEDMLPWINYFTKKYGNFVNPEYVKKVFTEIRQQIAIDEEGKAKEHSLRTIRVAKKGLVFKGDIELKDDNENFVKLLYLACLNLRRFGTKRNRGFGAVRCRLFDGEDEINLMKELEA